MKTIVHQDTKRTHTLSDAKRIIGFHRGIGDGNDGLILIVLPSTR